jgi:fructose-bisphosphate aldolase class 1
MLNLNLNVYVGEAKTGEKTQSAVANQALVSSMVEMPYGVKVTLSTGEVFHCSNEFVPTFMKANEDNRFFHHEDRMHALFTSVVTTLAPKVYCSDHSAKESTAFAEKIASFATKVAGEWREFRNEVMF